MSIPVLVVDDSQLSRNMVGFMFARAGFDVHYAVDGREAFEMAMAMQFDLIVTDINMPQIDGRELIRRLRATTAYQSTPIIVISTRTEAEERLKGLEAGANLFVVKPIRENDLLKKAGLLLSLPGICNELRNP